MTSHNNGIRPRVKINVHQFSTNKGKTARDAFLQGFLITIYSMIIDKGILTLLVKITCYLIKRDVQY